MPLSDKSRPKVVMIASTGPSPEHPYQAVFIRRWARQLLEAGCNVRVLTRRHITLGTYVRSWARVREFFATPRHFQYEWDGIQVDGLRMHMCMPLNYSKSATWLSLRAMRRPLRKIYDEFPYDIMYMATWGDFSLAAAKIAKELGVPYLATAIGGYENRYYNKTGSIPYRTQRELYKGSKLVLCVSKDLERKVRIMTDGNVPTLTWDSGVDTSLFAPSPSRRTNKRKQLGLNDDELLVSFVGRLVKSKGIYELINAFGSLVSERHRMKLSLIGYPYEERQIKLLLRSRQLETKTLIVGGIPEESVVDYLCASDLFVFPSWNEGLPNAVKEASACGLPIVASNVGGIPEIVAHEESGLLVPVKDSVALMAAMRKLITNAPLRSQFGKEARNRVRNKFDYRRNGTFLADKIRGTIHSSSALKN